MSPYKNVYSEYVACGIGNLIQLYDNNKGPTTTLHYKWLIMVLVV